MTDTLTALDATFLELEQLDEGALMSIGGAMIFDPSPTGGAPSLEDVRERTAEGLLRLPRYSDRLSATDVGGLAWPRWVHDDEFDISKHVRQAKVRAPGGDRELCDWVGRFFSRPLDRTRPLWELALLEGLEHNRWALVQKTHHCLVDGVGSVDVLVALLDHDQGPSSSPTQAASSEQSRRRWDPLMEHVPQALIQAGSAGMHAARGGAHAAAHPKETLTRSRGLAELLIRDEIIGAPHNSLNVKIGRSRRFAVVRSSLAELKAIGRELGGSVNDVVLAACTTGLRELLLERSERPPTRGLRAMVPLNLRQASERLALGNKVSSLFVELPVAEAVAVLRFEKVARATRQLKDSDAPAGVDTFLDLAGLAPPVVHAAFARSAYATRLFNVTITNVPGPQYPLFAFGSRLHEVLPFVPLAAEHAVGIAIFSYDGAVTFGISADRESMPDLRTLVDGITTGLEELASLSRQRRNHKTEGAP
jgi:WS/DGAT/MGAT family acyltransferase